jgi:KDO2-lipid IV(A) lauroyltransferase
MKPLLLSDIPIEETRPPEPEGPPLSWAFSADRNQKAAWRNFWLAEPVMGGLNYVTHHALRLLSVSGCSRFGAVLAPFARARFAKSNFARRIEKNLRTLCPDRATSDEAMTALLTSWWDNIGRVFAEFSVTNRHFKAGLVEVSGKEHFDAIRSRGQRVIFVSVHVGHWEAQMFALAEAMGTVLTGPFQPEPSRFTNRLVYQLRKRREQFFFPPGRKSAFRLNRLLQEREANALIYVDDVRDRQIYLPLFGRPAPDRGNAVAAIKLAMANDAALIPVYMVRSEGANYHLTLLPPIQPASGNGRAEDIRMTIEAINGALEPVVLEHIDQWYMLAELRL